MERRKSFLGRADALKAYQNAAAKPTRWEFEGLLSSVSVYPVISFAVSAFGLQRSIVMRSLSHWW